jgi:hypothetical protein
MGCDTLWHCHFTVRLLQLAKLSTRGQNPYMHSMQGVTRPVLRAFQCVARPSFTKS